MSPAPQPKSGILDILPYVAGKSKTGSAAPPIKLSSNENSLGPSPLAVSAYQRASANLHRYPDPASQQLREAIANVHRLNVSQIVCGAGSDELIGLAVHGYAGQNDEVIITQHGFLMYKIYTQAAGATAVIAPETNLKTDMDTVIASVTPRTRIVFIANPNNPTGSYLNAQEMQSLRQRLRSDILLVIDGAYSECVTAADYTDSRELVDAGNNTIILRTFSKIYGLPALRLGWSYAPPEITAVLNRIRGPFNISSPAMEAGIAAVNDTAYTQACIEHNTRWRDWLREALQEFRLKIYPSEGNFLLVEFPLEGRFTAAAVNAHLLSHNIIVRDVSNYGLPNHLRITVGTEAENYALLKALKDYPLS